jgi:hypothetical protein
MWIRKYGIVTKKPDPIPEKPRTEPDQATLFRLYHDEELNLAQIGERYGHSRNWAAKLMDKYGIERRQKGWLPPVPDSYTPDPVPVPPPRTGKGKERITQWAGYALTVRKSVAEEAKDILPELQANPVPVYPKETYSKEARLRASVMVDDLRMQFQLRRAMGREARI